jgi:hypothetical protein
MWLIKTKSGASIEYHLSIDNHYCFYSHCDVCKETYPIHPCGYYCTLFNQAPNLLPLLFEIVKSDNQKILALLNAHNPDMQLSGNTINIAEEILKGNEIILKEDHD